MENNDCRKGVKTKLFGVGLIFLTALDSMLSWRGSFAVSDFYLLFFTAGCLLYAISAIRASNTQSSEGQPKPQR